MNNLPGMLTLSVLLLVSANISAGAEKPETWTEPTTGIKFIHIPKGCYQLGTPPALLPPGLEPPADPLYPKANELPRHEVCVDGFWMSQTEVTQKVWQQLMGCDPSGEPVNGTLPARNLTWDHATEFASKLGESHTGTNSFRLPTEAEWEYACRSGGKEDQLFAGANSLEQARDYVWQDGNTFSPTPTPPGSRRPNALGLYDMSGNVAEWVRDTYIPDAYSRHPLSNPLIELTDVSKKVVRGGSYVSEPGALRCAARGHHERDMPAHDIGFRLVRIPAELSPQDVWVFQSHKKRK